MHLQHLIDRLIDQAHHNDPNGSYNILIGIAPSTEESWAAGKKNYRWCPVIQTRLVPNHTVVLAPSPANFRHHDLVEYHGGIRNGDVTQHTMRRRPEADHPAPKPAPRATLPR